MKTQAPATSPKLHELQTRLKRLNEVKGNLAREAKDAKSSGAHKASTDGFLRLQATQATILLLKAEIQQLQDQESARHTAAYGAGFGYEFKQPATQGRARRGLEGIR